MRAEPYQRPRRRRIHYVAAVSTVDGRAVAACQQLFADFAQTSDAPLYADLAAGIADDPQLAGLLLAAPPPQRLPGAAVRVGALAAARRPDGAARPLLPQPPAAARRPAGRQVGAIDAFRDVLRRAIRRARRAAVDAAHADQRDRTQRPASSRRSATLGRRGAADSPTSTSEPAPDSTC